MNADLSAADVAALRAEVERLRVENAELRAQHDQLIVEDSRLQCLLESQIMGVFIGNLEGETVTMNRSFERIVGRTRAEFDGMHWEQCVPPEELERHRAKARLLWEEGWCPAWETLMLQPDGTRVPVVTGASLIRNAHFDGNCDESDNTILMWALDISERVNAENELRDSESKMRAIVENLHDGLILTDLDDIIFYANRRISEMTGYSNAELMGQNAHRFLVDPKFWKKCAARNSQREQGHSETYEIALRHRDGSTRWMLINGSPLRDASGTIIGTIGAHFDITKRKRDEAERARVAAQLESSNRDLETFAFAVSHDLKQPLRKIEVFSSWLQNEDAAQLSERGRLYLDRIGAASRRMTSLIDGLLAYSRVKTGDAPWSEVDLSQIAHEVLLDLEVAIEHAGADVQIGELPRVRASGTQMRQLLQNLVDNALTYRRPNVPLVVRVEGRIRDGQCEIEVSDNGRGFRPEQASHLFEIFSRLNGNANADGAGVGLTICRAIVERHGGTLSAQGALGQGASFRARFPLISPQPKSENARESDLDR